MAVHCPSADYYPTRSADLLTYLFTYLLTYSLTHFLTDLLIFLLTDLLTNLLTCLLTYSFTYFITYLLSYLLTYSLTFLLTELLTHLFTYSFPYLLLLTYLLNYSLTPWSRVLLEKLTDSQSVKKFPAPYETRRFRTAFTTTCPYPKPDQSSPCPHTPLPEVSSLYYPPKYACVFQVVSFPQVSPPKSCIHLSSLQ